MRHMESKSAPMCGGEFSSKFMEAKVLDTTTKNRVMEARLQEGMSRADLAKSSDLTEPTIQRVEKGNENVSSLTKNKIVNGFNSRPNRKREYTYEYLFPCG